METAEKIKSEKLISEAGLNNLKQNEEEIIAQHNDKDMENQLKTSMDKSSKAEATYSNIVFNKHELFFNSLPNVMAFDSVVIKNTGKTCVYYKWQKNNKLFKLEEKKVTASIDFIVTTQTVKYSQMKKENSPFLFFRKKMAFLAKNGF